MGGKIGDNFSVCSRRIRKWNIFRLISGAFVTLSGVWFWWIGIPYYGPLCWTSKGQHQLLSRWIVSNNSWYIVHRYAPWRSVPLDRCCNRVWSQDRNLFWDVIKAVTISWNPSLCRAGSSSYFKTPLYIIYSTNLVQTGKNRGVDDDVLMIHCLDRKRNIRPVCHLQPDQSFPFSSMFLMVWRSIHYWNIHQIFYQSFDPSETKCWTKGSVGGTFWTASDRPENRPIRSIAWAWYFHRKSHHIDARSQDACSNDFVFKKIW